MKKNYLSESRDTEFMGQQHCGNESKDKKDWPNIIGIYKEGALSSRVYNTNEVNESSSM